jgi:hypothetical protein
MAKCFCGCGRKIRFLQRVPNNYGKTAAMFVGKLERMNLDDDSEGHIFLDQGREWFAAYAAATHLEIPLKTLSIDEWREWRKAAYRIVKAREAMWAKLGKWAKAEGLTAEDALITLAAMSPDEREAFNHRLGLYG